jgi:hypothetical protein
LTGQSSTNSSTPASPCSPCRLVKWPTTQNE